MMLGDSLTVILLIAGSVFFLAGTLGLLRFPDVYTRLHALTKADNVGLGLMVAGLALHGGGQAAVDLAVGAVGGCQCCLPGGRSGEAKRHQAVEAMTCMDALAAHWHPCQHGICTSLCIISRAHGAQER